MAVTYLENNRAGITVYGFMLDRSYLHTILESSYPWYFGCLAKLWEFLNLFRSTRITVNKTVGIYNLIYFLFLVTWKILFSYSSIKEKERNLVSQILFQTIFVYCKL